MIRWSTLIANEQGDIDYYRVGKLVSVLLAFAGGVMAVWVVFLVRNVDNTLVSIAVAALVLPLTGGTIAGAITAFSGKRASAAIVAGDAPGRRAGDPPPTPIPGGTP